MFTGSRQAKAKSGRWVWSKTCSAGSGWRRGFCRLWRSVGAKANTHNTQAASPETAVPKWKEKWDMACDQGMLIPEPRAADGTRRTPWHILGAQAGWAKHETFTKPQCYKAQTKASLKPGQGAVVCSFSSKPHRGMVERNYPSRHCQSCVTAGNPSVHLQILLGPPLEQSLPFPWTCPLPSPAAVKCHPTLLWQRFPGKGPPELCLSCSFLH